MINDDTLILYYYQDGLSQTELNHIQTALDRDPELKQRYEDLIRELTEIEVQTDVECPSHLKHQWHALIDGAAASERQRQQQSHPRFSWMTWGASVAGALMIGIALGVYLLADKDRNLPKVVQNNDAPKIQEPSDPAVGSGDSFNRGLLLHLQSSQTQLGQLVNNGDADKQALLVEIIRQNRMFEQAAEAKQAPEVARVLRAFEPILMQLASDEVDAEAAEALQRQLEFEMNIVVTKLGLNRSNETHAI